MQDRSPISWRRLGPVVLVPNLFYGIGQSAIIPAVPLLAAELDPNLALAALASAMIALGQLVGTLPGGWLISKVGENATMVLAAVISIAGGLAGFLAPNVGLLIFAVLISGLASSVTILARNTYLTVAIPAGHRGRAMSLLAGFMRLGSILGPFGTTAAIVVTGEVRTAFLIPVASSFLAVAILLLFGLRHAAEHRALSRPADGSSMWSTATENRDVILRLGLPAGMVTTMRTTRQIVIPLIGLQIGLSSATIALIVTISAVLDFALTYPGGQILDRLGRLAVVIPAMSLLTLGHLIIGIAPLVPGSFVLYLTAIGVMSVGGGISGGVVATLGADVADRRNVAAFLSGWRLTTAIAPAVAPLLLAGTAAIVSIMGASVGMAALSGVGTLMLRTLIPRYIPKPGVSTAPDAEALPDTP